MKKLISVIFLFLLFPSCDEGNSVDCSTVLCAGPATLAFEVLQNGQNVFEDEMSSTDNISITGNFPDTFEFLIAESSYNGGTVLLFVQQINWEVSRYNFQLVIDDVSSQELSTSIALSTGDCCGGIPQISQYTVDGTALENPNRVVTLNLD